MAIQNLYPEIKPSLNLDFANVKALDPRISFARASSATYYGTQTAKAEENLIRYSQEFDNGAWTKSNVTVTANSTTAPDGTSTADKITPTTLNGFHIVYYLVQNTTLNTSSIFVKASELSKIAIRDSWDGTAYASFDLTTETVLVESQGTGSINSVGNGWYRLSFTLSSAQNYAFAIIPLLDSYTSGNPFLSYAGDGISGIFIWGAQLEQRSAVTAYTPTTTQAITNYIPVLQTASAGVARFDHDPVTGESLGLLVEEQRTNLLLRSEEFDNASWSKGDSTITANTVVAPDGTLTGDKLVSSATTATHFTLQAFSKTAQTYTASIFAKKGELRYLDIGFSGVANWEGTPQVKFDLELGEVTLTGSSATATILEVGNGWYRCIITSTSLNTTGSGLTISGSNLSEQIFPSYTGDGYSGIYIWQAQLEQGAFATSPIKTEASQVTRAADSASMTGANFSDWYAGGKGTVYSESAVYASNIKTQFVWDLSGDATATSLRTPHSTTARIRAVVGGKFTGAGTGAVIANNTFIKATVAWDGLNGRLQSGSVGENVTAVANLDATTFFIGNSGSASQLNGHIRKLAFWPQRLTDTQLATLTS